MRNVGTVGCAPSQGMLSAEINFLLLTFLRHSQGTKQSPTLGTGGSYNINKSVEGKENILYFTSALLVWIVPFCILRYVSIGSFWLWCKNLIILAGR